MIRYRDLLARPAERAPSKEALRGLEDAAGGELPEAYVRMVSAIEDLALPYSVFIDGRPYSFGLEDVESIASDLDEMWNEAWFRDRLPDAMLPFGRTGGEDDTLLLDLTDEGYGRVLAFISARPAKAGEKGGDRLHEVAPDLDAYLDGLVLLVRDLEGEDDDPMVQKWLAERPAPTPLVVDGVDWGPAFRLR